MMYITQNYRVLGLFPSSGILENRKHDVSETGSGSVLRRGGKTPTQFGHLERANHTHGNRSSFRNVVFSILLNTGQWRKSKNPANV
jgi:hypothetical protein